jgi:hypothetical protein
MKKLKIAYWIVTALSAASMLFSAIPDVMNTPEAKSFIGGGLGYPDYFIPFIGVMKVLGVIAILIPGYPRIKEWAYAGLTFDLIGAIYSIVSISGNPVDALGMAPFLLFLVASYFLYHRTKQVKNAEPKLNVQLA